jgi:hypothetical protein
LVGARAIIARCSSTNRPPGESGAMGEVPPLGLVASAVAGSRGCQRMHL